MMKLWMVTFENEDGRIGHSIVNAQNASQAGIYTWNNLPAELQRCNLPGKMPENARLMYLEHGDCVIVMDQDIIHHPEQV